MWLEREYGLILKLQILDLVRPNPPIKWKDGNKGDVILIQGVSGKWNGFEKVGNFLNQKGYRVHWVAELGYNLMKLNKGYEILLKYLQENKLKNFVLICHSKGCALAKLLLNDKKVATDVKTVLMLCSPNEGSVMAKFNPFAKELRPDSEFIKNTKLNTDELKKIVNIYPIIDNHIIPKSSLYLKGANNIEVPIKGHTLILTSNELLGTLEKYV